MRRGGLEGCLIVVGGREERMREVSTETNYTHVLNFQRNTHFLREERSSKSSIHIQDIIPLGTARRYVFPTVSLKK